jgi:hypothetical protein
MYSAGFTSRASYRSTAARARAMLSETDCQSLRWCCRCAASRGTFLPFTLKAVPQALFSPVVQLLLLHAAFVEARQLSADDPRTANQSRNDGNQHGSKRDRVDPRCAFLFLLLSLSVFDATLNATEDAPKRFHVGLHAAHVSREDAHLLTEATNFLAKTREFGVYPSEASFVRMTFIQDLGPPGRQLHHYTRPGDFRHHIDL